MIRRSFLSACIGVVVGALIPKPQMSKGWARFWAIVRERQGAFRGVIVTYPPGKEAEARRLAAGYAAGKIAPGVNSKGGFGFYTPSIIGDGWSVSYIIDGKRVTTTMATCREQLAFIEAEMPGIVEELRKEIRRYKDELPPTS